MWQYRSLPCLLGRTLAELMSFSDRSRQALTYRGRNPARCGHPIVVAVQNLAQKALFDPGGDHALHHLQIAGQLVVYTGPGLYLCIEPTEGGWGWQISVAHLHDDGSVDTGFSPPERLLRKWRQAPDPVFEETIEVGRFDDKAGLHT